MPPPAPGCASCAARDEEIALLRDQVDVLRAQQRELQDKIVRLERLISRNSGNSRCRRPVMTSRGRSSRGTARPGTAGKRRPGKQPGAPGAYLAWNDDPDHTVPHFPQGRCDCGTDLAEAEDLGVTAFSSGDGYPPDAGGDDAA